VFIIVMGVSGCGKSTVGQRLAQRLGWSFVEGDDFHSERAIDKMRRSIPLTEIDRKPWIDALVERLRAEANGCAVLACSALTHVIRERFRRESDGPVEFVYLKLDADRLRARLNARTHHFAKADLLDSQLATLQEPRRALTLDANAGLEVICQQIIDAFALIRH
jgi:gluconokinase